LTIDSCYLVILRASEASREAVLDMSSRQARTVKIIMSKQFSTILDKCISDLREGKSLEDCLKNYPKSRGELKPLLKMMDNLRASQTPSLSFIKKAELKEELLSSIRKAKSEQLAAREPKLGFNWNQIHFAKPALVTIGITVFLIISGVLVYASSSSSPSSPLYPVKMAVEKVRLALISNSGQKAELHLRFAEQKVEEIERIAKSDKNVELKLNEVKNNYQENIIQATQIAISRKDPKLLEDCQKSISQNQIALKKIQTKLPKEDKGGKEDKVSVDGPIESALTASEEQENQILSLQKSPQFKAQEQIEELDKLVASLAIDVEKDKDSISGDDVENNLEKCQNNLKKAKELYEREEYEEALNITQETKILVNQTQYLLTLVVILKQDKNLVKDISEKVSKMTSDEDVDEIKTKLEQAKTSLDKVSALLEKGEFVQAESVLKEGEGYINQVREMMIE